MNPVRDQSLIPLEIFTDRISFSIMNRINNIFFLEIEYY